MVRRRRWSDEEKGRIVAEAIAPGAVIADVARRHDLTPQHLVELDQGGQGWPLRAAAPTEANLRVRRFVPVVAELQARKAAVVAAASASRS